MMQNRSRVAILFRNRQHILQNLGDYPSRLSSKSFVSRLEQQCELFDTSLDTKLFDESLEG